mgnify:CR=1 FL=1
MKWNNLISELKRRHVFKSTIAYLAISWIVIQIASIILPTFDVPDYSLKILIYILDSLLMHQQEGILHLILLILKMMNS